MKMSFVSKSQEKISYRYFQIILSFAACVYMLQSFYMDNNLQGASLILQNALASVTGLSFMLSGCFLLERSEEGLWFFYKKRILRILPAFLLFRFFSLVSQIGFSVSVAFLKDYLKRLLTKGMEPCDWFFYSLWGFYLMAPFFARMLRRLERAEKKGLLFLLLGYFLFFNLGVIAGYRIAVSSYPFLNWTAYALMGYLVGHADLSKKQYYFGFLFGAFCLLVSSMECVYMPGKNWSLDSYCLSRAGICIGIFLIPSWSIEEGSARKKRGCMKKHLKDNPKCAFSEQIVVLAAKSSFFSFLLMPIGLRMMSRYSLQSSFKTKLLFTSLFFVVSLVAGMVAYCILERTGRLFKRKKRRGEKHA